MFGNDPLAIIMDDRHGTHRHQQAQYLAYLKDRSARRAAANDRAKPNHPTDKRAKVKAARAQRRKSRG